VVGDIILAGASMFKVTYNPFNATLYKRNNFYSGWYTDARETLLSPTLHLITEQMGRYYCIIKEGTNQVITISDASNTNAYTYLTGLGYKTNRYLFHNTWDSSTQYINLYKVAITSGIIEQVLVASFSGGYTTDTRQRTKYTNYYGGRLFRINSNTGKIESFVVDEDAGTIDLDTSIDSYNPFGTTPATKTLAMPVYNLTDRTSLVCYSTKAYLITANEDGTASVKVPTYSLNSSWLTRLYSEPNCFDANSRTWTLNKGGLGVYGPIEVLKYSEQDNDIYLYDTIDLSNISSVKPSSTGYTRCSDVSNITKDGLMLIQTYGNTRSDCYYFALSTRKDLLDFKAQQPESINFSATALTGYTTGATDENGKIEVSTVLPPTLSVNIKVDGEGTIETEGDI
jgi:hypothetical protein